MQTAGLVVELQPSYRRRSTILVYIMLLVDPEQDITYLLEDPDQSIYRTEGNFIIINNEWDLIS